MSSPSRFLTLPGEIRNHIYLQVALDAPIIRLFEGRVVLPPLASACRQIRKEMNGKYQKDATLNPATPVHALVTNFNFHSLSRWLDKHSRDLKDKSDAPRVLCITSVLLAPDAAANCSTSNGLPKPKAVAFDAASETPTHDATDRGAQKTLLVKLKLTSGALPRLGPGPTTSSQGTIPSDPYHQRTRFVKLQVVPGLRPRFGLITTTSPRQISPDSNNPGQEAFERTTSDEYRNSLRVLEQSLEEWCKTWTSCKDDDSEPTLPRYKKSSVRELRNVYFCTIADRSGTNYRIGWKARTIHREHPASQSNDTHGLQKKGVCYRGDFCDHFVFCHMRRMITRANQSRSACSWTFIVRSLECEMVTNHWFRAHGYHNSFQHMQKSACKGAKPTPILDRTPWKRRDSCGEVLRFYQRLDRHNIRNRLFEQEREEHWCTDALRYTLAHGTERVVPDDFSSEDPYRAKTRRAGSWEEDELNHLIYKMERWSLSA